MPDQTAQRQAWMSLLAKAPGGRAAELLDAAMPRPGFDWLRRPETGSVMVRGRTSGTGAPFNIGEMTVTRCTLRLESGEIGHAYLQGRSKADAEVAALVDALMQSEAAERLQEAVLRPLEAESSTRRSARAAKAAATKVDFFTMARGED